MLSYSAYGEDGFDEKLWLVALEYLVVIGFAVWEIFLKKIKPIKLLKSDRFIYFL